MTNDETNRNAQMTEGASADVVKSEFDIGAASLARELVSTADQVNELLHRMSSHHRIALDTEADSLHCYREKLCLLQLSLPERDYVIDPLANTDLSPLADALKKKEIVLHRSDFDLRLLRRSLKSTAARI